MLQRLKNRTHGDEGFTLVELLVVILIIGILAAIALPTFLGQSTKAQDSSAKSNARNAVSAVESCAADKQGVYTDCTETEVKKIEKGLSWGTGDGQVTVTPNPTGFVVKAISDNKNEFTITKTSGGAPTRGCKTLKEGGGCSAVLNGTATW